MFQGVKNKLNIEASWDRFLEGLGTPGEAKMWSPLRRESNFDIFGDLKINVFLDPKK